MRKLVQGNLIIAGLSAIFVYLMLSLLDNLSALIKIKFKLTPQLMLFYCFHNKHAAICIVLSLLLGFLIAVVVGDRHSLDVRMNRVGNGQYGKARFMTQAEKNKTFSFVPRGEESTPGFVIGYNERGWRPDISDNSMLLVSPPGGGKTKREIIPTIKYNAEVNRVTGGYGASMIITDAKGELKATCTDFLKEAGYTVYSLNFRYPLQSYHYNLMYNVNKYIDEAKAANDRESKVIAQAKAEKYAKVLSSSIIHNASMTAANTSESSEYFNDTSEGLLTAIILLVSEYGVDGERHIVSVFHIIIDLNGISEDSTDTLQKNRLEQLFNLLPQENRSRLFAGPSTKADARTSMNIFSSALGKLVNFIDAELEQLICDHSTQLNTVDFIEKPTAIFLIVPDEDTTKHFFSSLFIRNIMNELIALAEKESTGVLKRPVICEWDEFGQIPPVKDFAMLVTAARSRGIRFMCALQSLGQLEEKYSPAQAKTIRDAFQMTMFGHQSPNANDTAKHFSEVMGQFTTQSGSVSRGDKSDSSSVQLIGRSLMTVDEIITMPANQFIVMKSGEHPVKTKLPLYFKVLKDIQITDKQTQQSKVATIRYLTEQKIRRRAGAKYRIMPGQFDN